MGTVSLKMRLTSLVVCAIITLNNCPVSASDDLNIFSNNNRIPEHGHDHDTNHDHHDHSKHGEHTTEVIFLGKQYGEESGRKAEQISNIDDLIHDFEDHNNAVDADQTIHDLDSLEVRLSSISNNTWMASFCSIGIISFVGLLTVGIIPMMKVSTLSDELHLNHFFLIGQGPHQETALQLLVSLAVGTLVGDALIHLLPHALSSDHGDTDAVWKGFTATLTIIAFFVMDRVLEGLGHGHSHGPGHHHDSRDGGDEENLTSSTRTSRESTPISKVSWKYLASDPRSH